MTLLALLWTYIACAADLINGMDAALRRVLLIRFASVPAGFVGSIPVILLGWGHVALALRILVPPAVRLLRVGDIADRHATATELCLPPTSAGLRTEPAIVHRPQ